MANTVVKRVGGKYKLRSWIKKHLPNHDLYCEPFSGSFAVGLSLPPATAKYRKVFNDLDENLHNFFKVVRDNKTQLLEKLVNTLYSRKEHQYCHESIISGKANKLDPIEWARQYLVYNRQSFSGKEDGSWCRSINGENIADTWAKLDGAITELSNGLAGCFIECEDYRKVFQKWDSDNTLFYCDPPYEDVEGDYYPVNKKDGFNHKEFAKQVSELKGSVAISYYDSEFVRGLYAGFTVHTIDVVKHMQRTGEITEENLQGKKSKGTEILLIKGECSEDIL